MICEGSIQAVRRYLGFTILDFNEDLLNCMVTQDGLESVYQASR